MIVITRAHEWYSTTIVTCEKVEFQKKLNRVKMKEISKLAIVNFNTLTPIRAKWYAKMLKEQTMSNDTEDEAIYTTMKYSKR